MQDPLIPLNVHRVVSQRGTSGQEFAVVYYFEGAPETGLMRELITIYRSKRWINPAADLKEMLTEVNWSAIGSVKDPIMLERFCTALEDARKLKSALDLGLVLFDGTKLVGAEWWAL